MANRKRKAVQDVPVDRMDDFLKSNYKMIITVLAGIFLVFIIGYGVRNMVKQSRQTKVALIGQMETAGFDTDQQVKEYARLAETLIFAEDYIHMQAAEQYARLGYPEDALSELGKVGGHFVDYARSLSYDMGKMAGKESVLYSNGPFAPVWHYRAVLAAEEGERTALIADFKEKWPESLLLKRIEMWGL